MVGPTLALRGFELTQHHVEAAVAGDRSRRRTDTVPWRIWRRSEEALGDAACLELAQRVVIA
jgi:hypothetical protein